MKRRLIMAALFLFAIAGLTHAAEKSGPFFTCSFESRKAVEKLGGILHGSAKFVDGLKGKAVDLPAGIGCKLPSAKCLPKTDGTLSLWMKPHYILDEHTPRGYSIITTWKGEETFRPLGLGYGNIAKGIPHKLCMFLRKRKRPRKRQVSVRADEVVRWQRDTWQHVTAVWRINTGKKDGVLKLYVNGKMVARRTDFRAYEIEFGEHLWFVPLGVIDELKVWNRMLTDEEVKELFAKEKPAGGP